MVEIKPRDRGGGFYFNQELVALLAVHLALGNLLGSLLVLVNAVAATFDGAAGIGQARDRVPRVRVHHSRLDLSGVICHFHQHFRHVAIHAADALMLAHHRPERLEIRRVA